MASRTIFAQEPAKGWRPWGLLVPVLGIVFVVLTDAPLTIALDHAHLIDANDNPIGLAGFVAFLLLPFGALGLVVIAWVRLVERRPLSTVGLTASRRVPTFVLGHLTGVAMMCAIVAGCWAMGGFTTEGFARAFTSPEKLAAIAILMACFAVQSSAEELLFRGWMMSALAFKFGTVAAVLISSAVFTLLHFDPTASWLFAANVFLFAAFAACWVVRCGNVWGVMGWHAGWNWILGVGFELPVTGLNTHMPALIVKLTPAGPDYLTGGAQGAEASIACSAVLIAGIIYLILRMRSRTTNAAAVT